MEAELIQPKLTIEISNITYNHIQYKRKLIIVKHNNYDLNNVNKDDFIYVTNGHDKKICKIDQIGKNNNGQQFYGKDNALINDIPLSSGLKFPEQFVNILQVHLVD